MHAGKNASSCIEGPLKQNILIFNFFLASEMMRRHFVAVNVIHALKMFLWFYYFFLKEYGLPILWSTNEV